MIDKFDSAEQIFEKKEDTKLQGRLEVALVNIKNNPNKKDKKAFNILCHEINKKIKKNGGEISGNEIEKILSEINNDTLTREINGIKNAVEEMLKNSFDDKTLLNDTSQKNKTSTDEPKLKNKFLDKNTFNDLILPIAKEGYKYSRVSENGKIITFHHDGEITPLDEDYIRERISSMPKTQKIEKILFKKDPTTLKQKMN